MGDRKGGGEGEGRKEAMGRGVWAGRRVRISGGG